MKIYTRVHEALRISIIMATGYKFNVEPGYKTKNSIHRMYWKANENGLRATILGEFSGFEAFVGAQAQLQWNNSFAHTPREIWALSKAKFHYVIAFN